MGKNCNLIRLNIKKWKWLRFLNIFLASLFSLIGTISIVDFLMFLNITFNVGYFGCIVFSFVLSQTYSFAVNKMVLTKIENKTKNIYLEIVKALDDSRTRDSLKLEENNRGIEQRFENLSSKRKKELLMYVRNDLKNDDKFENENLSYEQINISEEMDDVVLLLGEGRSKSRNIWEESKKKY